MIKEFNALTHTLGKRHLKDAVVIQVLIILATVAEMVPVAVIPTLVLIATDSNASASLPFLSTIYGMFGQTDHQNLILRFAIFGSVAVAAANVFALLCNKRILEYGTEIGHELTTSFFRHTLDKHYLYFTQVNSSALTNSIVGEMMRVQSGILLQMLTLNAKVIGSLPLVAVLLYQDPVLAISGLFVVGLAYATMFKLVRKKLVSNSAIMSNTAEAKYRVLNETFSGIKEVKLMHLEDLCAKAYEDYSRRSAKAVSTNLFISSTPKHVLEIISVSGICLLTLYVFRNSTNQAATTSLLSLYAIVGYKLIPIAQQIFASITTINSNASALHQNMTEIKAALAREPQPAIRPHHPLHARASIQLRDVSFRYPGQDDFVLKNLTMNIQAGSVVAIVGGSGAGKTTVIDLLMCLIPMEKGQLLCDGVPVTAELRDRWQQSVSYVPQDVFLLDASILDNVMFNYSSNQTDTDKVWTALEAANLAQYVRGLPNGLSTRVGERGIQMSGGQKQRLGIARALYREASLIVLDEATNALDSLTEKDIMDTFLQLRGNKTVIIISHRLSSLKFCDHIFFLERGSISDSGDFESLSRRHALFGTMAHTNA